MRRCKILFVGALSVGALVLMATAAAAAAPHAHTDYVKTAENKKVTFGVLVNDTPGTGDKIDPTSLNINTFPTYGDIELNLEGKFTYTPPAGFNGKDSFTYLVCAVSNLNQCDTATVFITVGTGVTTTTTIAPPPPPPPPPPPAPVAAAAPTANELPRTGTSGTLLAVGVALCAVGAFALRATKRRGGAATER
jgi:hypothetical protein